MSVLTSDPSVKHEESTWILKSGVDLRIVVFAYAATGSKQTNLGDGFMQQPAKLLLGYAYNIVGGDCFVWVYFSNYYSVQYSYGRDACM